MSYIAPMATLTVEMPEVLRSWIEQQVEDGRFVDASDYLRDLVRRASGFSDARMAWMRELVAEGLASGIVDEEPEDVIEQLIAEIPAQDD